MKKGKNTYHRWRSCSLVGKKHSLRHYHKAHLHSLLKHTKGGRREGKGEMERDRGGREERREKREIAYIGTPSGLHCSTCHLDMVHTQLLQLHSCTILYNHT
jgi:hypothetical protein